MSINGDLLVHKKLWVSMVRESSHHLTIRLQNLPYGYKNFKLCMHGIYLSYLRTLLHCWRISRFSNQNMALINCRYMHVHHKSAICTHAVSTRQNPTLTPKQTPKADPRSALCPLWVYFLKICVSSKSAMVYSGSGLGVRFTHCSVVQTHHFSYHLDLRVYF